MKNILLITLLAMAAHSAKTLAVLEINPGSNEVPLTIPEFRHLTDELRTRAREALPRNSYNVLTRDNIFQLLPPDEEQAECLDEACVVQIGRVIGAEYVTQGIVGNFGEMLTLTVELYESMSGNLIGSFVTESKDVMGLLATVRERAPGLFATLSKDTPPSGHPSVRGEFSSLDSSPTSSPKKSNSAFIVALSLDLLGATMLGFGIYQNAHSNKLYDDYKKRPKPTDFENIEQVEAFEKAKKAEYKKVKDAEKLRNIGYAVGGALLTAGIAVHIWF